MCGLWSRYSKKGVNEYWTSFQSINPNAKYAKKSNSSTSLHPNNVKLKSIKDWFIME